MAAIWAAMITDVVYVDIQACTRRIGCKWVSIWYGRCFLLPDQEIYG